MPEEDDTGSHYSPLELLQIKVDASQVQHTLSPIVQSLMEMPRRILWLDSIWQQGP